MKVPSFGWRVVGLAVLLTALPTAAVFGSAPAGPAPGSARTSPPAPHTPAPPEPRPRLPTGSAPPSLLSASLPNGDFEGGPTAWEEHSAQGRQLILHQDDLPVPPHGGDWAAWLGGADDEVAFISQTVSVPAGAVLTYWEWISSTDACGCDFATVKVNGADLQTRDLCLDTNTGGWTHRTVDLSAYAALTVALQISVTTDMFLVSDYFVDDVALEHAVYLPLALKNHWAGFFDDFSNPSSGWPVGDNAVGTWGYLDGEYRHLLKGPYSWMLDTPGPDHQLLYLPEDYRVEVDARQVSAAAGSHGLMFGVRWASNSHEGYQFLIYPPSRQYLLEKRTLAGSWQTPVGWTTSSAIQSTGVNHLRVDRIGPLIRLYANGVLLTTYSDASFTGAGRDAGLKTVSYGGAPVDVRCDNFSASQP